MPMYVITITMYSICAYLCSIINILSQSYVIVLHKIALPYPHKCLFGFVEAKRDDQQYLDDWLLKANIRHQCQPQTK